MNDYLINNINKIIRTNYYDFYLKNEINNSQISQINQINNSQISQINQINNKYIKLDYFLLLKIYIIHQFFYYFEKNNIFMYSLFLYLQNIIGEIYISNIKYYQLKYCQLKLDNIYFLNNAVIYFFNFLLFNEIYFNKNIIFSNKYFLLSNLFLFQLGIIINKLFNKRIDYINKNNEFNNEFNFLFLLPGFENINLIAEKTKIFNYFNFYMYLNILFIFFL